MLVSYRDNDLKRMYVDAEYDGGYPSAVVTAYAKRMQQIYAAPDERDFYAKKSLHFEKLKGNRSHQHSMRLNDQWRLVLELEGKGPKKTVVVVSIEDYH